MALAPKRRWRTPAPRKEPEREQVDSDRGWLDACIHGACGADGRAARHQVIEHSARPRSQPLATYTARPCACKTVSGLTPGPGGVFDNLMPGSTPISTASTMYTSVEPPANRNNLFTLRPL